MRLSVAATLLIVALPSICPQNIRRPQRYTAHRIAQTLFAVENTDTHDYNSEKAPHQNLLGREFENAFAEDLDHWNRMLEENSLATQPTTTKAPTSTKPPMATPPPAVELSSVPSYVPSMAPMDVPEVPTTMEEYEPSEGPIADVSPTTEPAPSYAPAYTVGPTLTATVLPATTWDIIISRPTEFSILIVASEAVGFDKALQTDEIRTIFAPNNTAFQNLIPVDLLDKYFDFDLWTNEYIYRLLFCHDISGSIIFSFQFQNGTKVLPCLDFVDPSYLITTPPLQISKDTMPTPANVADGDLLAQNGVIHVIDQVLTNSFLRLALPAAASAFGGFEILIDLIDTAGLLDLLSGPGPFTVFAPPDIVFNRYGQEFIDGLKNDPEALRETLLNHVVTDVIIPCCLFEGATYSSAAGFDIVIDNVQEEEPRNFTVNGVPTIPILTGLLASNAKVNTINDILFHPDAPVPPLVSPTAPPVEQPGTTWDIILSRPEEFATFILASEAVGYDARLQRTTSRTVFVPNEAAFESLTPPDLLTKYFNFDTWSKEYVEILLFCHELTGEVVLSTDLTNGTQLSPCLDLIAPVVVVTLPPARLNKPTMPEPADILEVDLGADNGVVHVIDQVLINSFLRFNFIEAAKLAGGYSVLLDLLELTGLSEFASGPGPFTIFAPPDEVFESYGQDFVDGLKSDLNLTTTVLLNHVVPNLIIPCCLEEKAEFLSAAGESLILDDFDPSNLSSFTVNGIATIPAGTDLLTSNSKVNTISDILIPLISTMAPSPGASIIPSLGDTSVSPDSEVPETEAPTPGASLIPSLGDTSVAPDSELPETEAPTPATSFIPSLGDTSVAPDSEVPKSEAPTQSAPSLPPLPPQSVWDIIMESPDEYSIFISVAEGVGYDELLRSSAEITLFAPINEAFDNLMPPDLLVKYFDVEVWTTEYFNTLLSCHDIDGAAILSSELSDGAEFATCMDLIDPEFRFTSPPPQIQKDTMPVPGLIIGPDQESLNGVVHTVDQVLTASFLREDMPNAATKLGKFSILLELVVLTDLLTFASGEGPFTIFAPSDEVFERYGSEFIEGLKMDPDGTQMLLLNHVVSDLIVPCCLTERTEFISALGFPIVLDNINSDNSNIFTVNGIDTVPEFTNFLTSNAKLNEINDVLLPPNNQ